MTGNQIVSSARSEVAPDSLSDILSLAVPRQYGSGLLDFGASWSLRIGAHKGIKCYAVARGSCWLAVEDTADPLRLECDDYVLLASGRPFLLCSALDVPPMAVSDLPAYSEKGICTVNGGGACQIFGGHFKLDEEYERAFARALPKAVVVRDAEERDTLRWLLERMKREYFEPQAGSRLVTQHISHMMLIYALRLHLQTGMDHTVGWLSALADRRIAAAISAIHAAPARSWTVQALAREARMSRTSFAQRFKELTGVAPMAYLAQRRITLGAIRLRAGGGHIASIAHDVGYRSESAFSSAFRRKFGVTPRDYARLDWSVADRAGGRSRK